MKSLTCSRSMKRLSVEREPSTLQSAASVHDAIKPPSWFRVQGLGLRVQGLGLGFGFWVFKLKVQYPIR